MPRRSTWQAQHAECQQAVDAIKAKAETFEAEARGWRNLVADLFTGEECPMWLERGGTLACIDCGVRCTEDVSDIEHEDGCVVGPLYAAITTGSLGAED